MRKARIIGEGSSCYHVMSRTVSDTDGGLMLFGAHEKNVFAKQLRKHARFCGVEVLTWCMMDNHFHLLIRIPERTSFLADQMADGRRLFWQRLKALYDPLHIKALRREIDELPRTAEGRHRADEILDTYTRRMADLSEFVRGLKQAFSVWFNCKHRRQGTLWMDRFKSVLLEGESWVLKKVAAYVDLNPIRAGLVKDPGRYRWSGYGEAVGGCGAAQQGLSAIYGYCRNEWRRIACDYRALLYLEGVEVKNASGEVIRRGVEDQELDRKTPSHGDAPGSKRLSKRVSYFGKGAAIGGREFVEGVFERNRSMFGSKRKTGARRFKGRVWKGEGIFSLRDVGPD